MVGLSLIESKGLGIVPGHTFLLSHNYMGPTRLYDLQE